MYRSKSLLAAAVAAMMALPMAASAGTVKIVEAAGSGKVTTGLTGFATEGDEMDGMVITAFFSGGGKSSAVWGTTGVDAGAAVGSGWSLSVTGDTFTAPWILTNAAGGPAIVSLLIDGVPGKTVFDDDTPDPGTVGSASGAVFAPIAGGGPLDIVATYFDVLSVGKAAPVGDVYTKVMLDFTNAGGFAAGSTLTFRMDTDNAATEVRDVPEPATCTLLGIGVAGLVGYRARRRKV